MYTYYASAPSASSASSFDLDSSALSSPPIVPPRNLAPFFPHENAHNIHEEQFTTEDSISIPWSPVPVPSPASIRAQQQRSATPTPPKAAAATDIASDTNHPNHESNSSAAAVTAAHSVLASLETRTDQDSNVVVKPRPSPGTKTRSASLMTFVSSAPTSTATAPTDTEADHAQQLLAKHHLKTEARRSSLPSSHILASSSHPALSMMANMAQFVQAGKSKLHRVGSNAAGTGTGTGTGDSGTSSAAPAMASSSNSTISLVKPAGAASSTDLSHARTHSTVSTNSSQSHVHVAHPVNLSADMRATSTEHHLSASANKAEHKSTDSISSASSDHACFLFNPDDVSAKEKLKSVMNSRRRSSGRPIHLPTFNASVSAIAARPTLPHQDNEDNKDDQNGHTHTQQAQAGHRDSDLDLHAAAVPEEPNAAVTVAVTSTVSSADHAPDAEQAAEHLPPVASDSAVASAPVQPSP